MGLATIGMEHMVNGATEYNEWTQRVAHRVDEIRHGVEAGQDQAGQEPRPVR
jgi:hypothetical protein